MTIGNTNKSFKNIIFILFCESFRHIFLCLKYSQNKKILNFYMNNYLTETFEKIFFSSYSIQGYLERAYYDLIVLIL